MRHHHRHSSAALLAVAVSTLTPFSAFAAQSANTSSQAVQQGQTNGVNNPAETITFEGQGSLNKIIGTIAFGFLNLTGTSGTPSITLDNGPNGAPTTYTDTSTSPTAFLNLASQNFTAPDVGVNSPTTAQQTQSALRLEWHWNGTVDGSNDLINDQIGYNQTTGSVAPSGGANRGPTVANPVYVNSTNHFDGTIAGTGPNNMVTLNGLSVSNNTGIGTYNTYSATNYDQAGNNLLGGTNRVQFSFSDYKTMDYSAPGTPSVFAAPGSPGYGNGNPALSAASGNLLGIGVAAARESYQSGVIANMPTSNFDPSTVSTADPTGTTYAAGPWNTAGLNNLSSTPVAANAVLIAANPGTGLSRLNKGDAQWLQTTGRLANGAQFNAVTRDADLGQRPTFATATGIDGTWAVGVNDGGDTTTTANANLQHSVGTMKFSGKSSDTEVYDTIAQSRMGAGVLALTSTISANSFGPVRSLDIDFNDLTDPQLPGGGTDTSKFISANLNTISTYQYQAVLLGYVTTVKAPNPTALAAYEAANPGLTDAQAWAQISSFNPSNLSDPTATGIKGDTTGDVAKFLANILNSQGSYQSLTTTNDPADAFLNNSYLLPNLLANSRDPSTGVISPNPNYDPAAFAKATAIYANKFNADFSGSSGKDTETTGAGSNYGAAVTGGNSPATFNGNIPITAFNANGTVAADGIAAPKGNWLFGNFNQNGTRDLSAVESALAADKALFALEPAGTTGAGSALKVTSGIANAPNSTVVSYTDINGTVQTLTKGDLIVMGDTLGQGTFTGKDLYNLAHGVALSDASGAGFANGTLTTASGAEFADQVRNGVLRKNTALDYLQANTTPGDPLRVSGSQNKTNDPTGINAFNKFDVNHDGLVNRTDALTVDTLLGLDYTNLTDQLGVTLKDANGNQQDLVDAVLADGHTVVSRSDLNLITGNLLSSGQLLPGDANFDGTVDLNDLNTVLNNLGATTPHWTAGNFDGAATIDLTDLNDVLNHLGTSVPGASFTTQNSTFSTPPTPTPEPASVAILASAALLLAPRRRTRKL